MHAIHTHDGTCRDIDPTTRDVGLSVCCLAVMQERDAPVDVVTKTCAVASLAARPDGFRVCRTSELTWSVASLQVTLSADCADAMHSPGFGFVANATSAISASTATAVTRRDCSERARYALPRVRRRWR